jgi:hypothetical protein
MIMVSMMKAVEIISCCEGMRSQSNVISGWWRHENRSIEIVREILAEHVTRVHSIVKIAGTRPHRHTVHVGCSTLLAFYNHKTLEKLILTIFKVLNYFLANNLQS